MLRKPKILLLDEPTASLDVENEMQVERAIRAATRSITTVTVSHKVRNVKDSDMIYVLVNGGVVESGDFEDLSRQKGVFHGLLDLDSLI